MFGLTMEQCPIVGLTMVVSVVVEQCPVVLCNSSDGSKCCFG